MSASQARAGGVSKFIVSMALAVGSLILSGLAGYAATRAWCRNSFDRSLVSLLIDSGHYGEAEQMLRARVLDVPSDARAILLLARALAGMDDVRGCIETLELVNDHSPMKPEALLRQGQAYLQLRDAQHAEFAFRRCVQHSDVDRETARIAWAQLAGLFGAKDRTDDLRIALWSLHEIVDERARIDVQRQLVELSLVRQEPKARAEQLKSFIAGNPHDFEARVALGLAYLESNAIEDGMRIIRECLDSKPLDPNAWRAWLRAVYQEGDLAKLAQELESAPRELAEQSGYWKLRALVAQENGDWDHADECLAKAIVISPGQADLHGQRAIVLSRLKRTTEADQEGQTARQLRDAYAALRVAYEDWLQAKAANSSTESRATIAHRIAQAYQDLGLAREARAWENSTPPARTDHGDR